MTEEGKMLEKKLTEITKILRLIFTVTAGNVMPLHDVGKALDDIDEFMKDWRP